MSYNAYHKKIKTINRGDNPEWDKLIEEDNNYAQVENIDYLCGAHELDGDPTEPFEILQQEVSEHLAFSESSDEFSFNKEDFESMIKRIREEFPDHPETESTIATLQKFIDDIDADGDDPIFTCF